MCHYFSQPISFCVFPQPFISVALVSQAQADHSVFIYASLHRVMSEDCAMACMENRLNWINVLFDARTVRPD